MGRGRRMDREGERGKEWGMGGGERGEEEGGGEEGERMETGKWFSQDTLPQCSPVA